MPSFKRLELNDENGNVAVQSEIVSSVTNMVMENIVAERLEHQKHILRIIDRLRSLGFSDKAILKLVSIKDDEWGDLSGPLWTRTLPQTDSPPKHILDMAEREIQEAMEYEWPENQRIILNAVYDLHLYYSEAQRRAAIFRESNGASLTVAWYIVETPNKGDHIHG